MVHVSPDKLLPLYEGNGVAGLMSSHFLTDPEAQSRPLYVDSTNDRVLTVAEFRALVPKASYLIQNKYGVKRGDVVALFGINHIFTPVIHLAVIALGAILSPANIMYSAEELAHQLRMVKAPLTLVYDPVMGIAEEAAKIAKSPTKSVPFSAFFAELEALIKDDNAPRVEPIELNGVETPAYYCFSSGTSGLPKGVITTHYNILSNILQVSSSSSPFLNRPDLSQSIVLPMSHIYALNVGIWGAIHAARTNLVFPKFDLEDFVSKSAKYEIKALSLVPPIVLLLGKTDIMAKYPAFGKNVQLITSGAAPLSRETIELVTKKEPTINISQGYGLTETSPITHDGSRDLKNYDPASIGWLVPGTEAMLVDPETGKEVLGEQSGELWLRGPMIMKGYLNNEKATKETLTDDGWLKTGDVAVVKNGGQFYIVDRIKELIKSNGHQVAPAELEALLLTNPKVQDAAVIGVYNADKTSENPRAYVVLSPGTSVKEIVNWFNQRVAKHKRLWGGAVQIDVVPKSASGKIQRRELRGRSDEAVYGDEVSAL